VLGFDVPSNIGIVALGLLYGEGDFEKSLCLTVNCGEDTDCTAATVGSIFGVIHGAAAIPQRWIEPIGRSIKTACLNLGELGYFGNQLPQNVDDLTDRTERIARQVLARNGGATIEDAPGDTSDASVDGLKAGDVAESLYRHINGTVHRFDFFDVAVDYGGSATIRDGEPKQIVLTVTNKYRISATLDVHWYVPEGFVVSPSADSSMHVKQTVFEAPKTHEYTVCAERVPAGVTRMAVELTSNGRPLVMLVPIALINGNR
jgi:hypothetical protein